MKIFWSNEVWEWYRNNNLQNFIDEKDIYYNEPVLPEFVYKDKLLFNVEGNRPNQDVIVESVLSNLIGWTECLVIITQWGVWPSAEDWPRFYSWRGNNGSKFSLYDAPGHLFNLTDFSELKELLTQVFEFGWEGYLLFKSNNSVVDPIVFVSHDGWLEVKSNFHISLNKTI
jgi:hypothetical protein